MRLLITPVLDSIEWKQVKIVLPPTMKRFTAAYEDLQLQLDISIIDKQNDGWKTAIHFSTYRNFTVKNKSGVILLQDCGNHDLIDASLAFYKKYKKWPSI